MFTGILPQKISLQNVRKLQPKTIKEILYSFFKQKILTDAQNLPYSVMIDEPEVQIEMENGMFLKCYRKNLIND
uniref:Uncharacterized protein n=1 Tax=Acrobeloides nanus TaxID=290746 RepID=A0A914EN67_9BILA